MKRYVLTDADRAKSLRMKRGGSEAAIRRREMELILLDKLHAELAMPERYPER